MYIPIYSLQLGSSEFEIVLRTDLCKWQFAIEMLIKNFTDETLHGFICVPIPVSQLQQFSSSRATPVRHGAVFDGRE
jgi:hypothetical protein